MAADARRAQLLDAALDLALERGFHAVTVDGVARACGVTRPVVYGLFVDRDALLTALGEQAEQRALTQLARVLPPLPAPGDAAAPDEVLAAGIEAYLLAVQADPRTWRVILAPPDGVPPALAARVAAQRTAALDVLRELCAWGLSERGGPQVDPDLFARSVQALAETAARLLLDDPAHFSVTSFTLFTRTLLSALGPR